MKLTIKQVLALAYDRVGSEKPSLGRNSAQRRLGQAINGLGAFGDLEIEIKPKMSEEATEVLKNSRQAVAGRRKAAAHVVTEGEKGNDGDQGDPGSQWDTLPGRSR